MDYIKLNWTFCMMQQYLRRVQEESSLSFSSGRGIFTCCAYLALIKGSTYPRLCTEKVWVFQTQRGPSKPWL